MIRLVDDLPGAVEPEDVIPHGARPPRLSLVLVPEELLPREPSSVVQLAVGEDAEEGGLAGVDVAHDCDPDFHEVLLVGAAAHEELRGLAGGVLLAGLLPGN